jgi:hypothetical protein
MHVCTPRNDGKEKEAEELVRIENGRKQQRLPESE